MRFRLTSKVRVEVASIDQLNELRDKIEDAVVAVAGSAIVEDPDGASYGSEIEGLDEASARALEDDADAL